MEKGSFVFKLKNESVIEKENHYDYDKNYRNYIILLEYRVNFFVSFSEPVFLYADQMLSLPVILTY